MTLTINALTNPMNTKITKSNYYSVLEKVRKKATKDDFEKVQAIITMSELASLGGNENSLDYLEGKSFNQMIKQITKNLEEQEKDIVIQKNIAKEKSKIRKKYIEVISWSYDIINIKPYEKGIKIYLEAKNKKNIDIEAFEGILTVKDKLGNSLLETTLTCNINFPKNSEEVFNWTVSEMDDYNAVKDISQFDGKGDALTFYFDITKLIVDGNEI